MRAIPARLPAWLGIIARAGLSLGANLRRSLAVTASLACGVAALCLIGGYYEYTYWGLAQSLIRSQYGHIQLYAPGYLAERDIDPFAKPIERDAELLELLRSDPDIAAAAGRRIAFGTARNPKTGATAVVEVRGVVPEDETAIFTFMTSKRGPLLKSSDTGLCQIAPTLAKDLGLGLNDELVASVADAWNGHNAMSLKVKTLIGSYTADFDSLALNVPASVFADLFGFEGTQEIVVLLKDGVSPERKLADLKRDLGRAGFGLEYRLWYDQAEYFKQVLSYFQGFYRIVLAMAWVLAFFVCAATIGITLNERMREFGARMGMGESRARIVASLSVEAMLLGIAGLAAGALLSFVAGWIINASGGIEMGTAPGMSSALRVMLRFSPQGAALSILTCIFVIWCTCKAVVCLSRSCRRRAKS